VAKGISVLAIGAGDGGWEVSGHAPPKFGKKIFFGQYHVKFGHFVNIPYIFSGKNVLPPKVD